MGDSYGNPQQRTRNHEVNRDNSRGAFRGGRNSGGREGGGFRIRLSDNELRAARSLQEAFNLRSTVAVLGFAIRTLAQLLEEGKLSELVTQSQAQATHGDNRREEGRQSTRRNRFDGQGQNSTKGGPKPNPFERPEKPQPSLTENTQEEEKTEQSTEEIENQRNLDQDLSIESSSEEDQPATEVSKRIDEEKTNQVSER